jgi:adenylate cyclase
LNRSIILAAIVISAAVLANGYLGRRAHALHRPSPSAVVSAINQDKAIAVLPLTDLSSSNEGSAFCESIRRELITALTKTGRLKVVSSSDAIPDKAGETPDVREAGKKLGVDRVLVGSVHRAGNRVRITLQLIDVETGNHVWAEAYDRELTDVIAMESEIATTVAKQLVAASKA